MNKQTQEAAHLRPNPEWLARRTEPVLEPEQPIIDAHHHLWDRAGWPYSADDLQADAGSGHAVCATVVVECRTHYRSDGPEAMRPLGETEWDARYSSDEKNFLMARTAAFSYRITDPLAPQASAPKNGPSA